MHPPVWRTLRQLPAPVWFIFLGTFINKFGTFVVPFLALHLTRLGFSTREAGLALGAYGVGIFGASALGGHLADTFGRRRTIVLSMLSGAVSMLLLSQVQDFFSLLAMSFLTGLTGELHRPASSALLADLVPERDRVAAFAGYRFAVNAGFAFGPAVAGMLAHYSYLWLFVGDAITSALYGLLALTFLPSEPGRRLRVANLFHDARRSLIEAGRAAWADRPFVSLVLACFGVGVVFFQLFSTLGLHLKAMGFPEQVYGLVLGLNGAIVVLLEIPMCSVTQRLKARPVIAAGFALIACGAGLLAFVTSAWGFALGMAVLTLGETISMPVSIALASKMAPEAMRGRYLGIYGLTWAAALTCGPSLGMALFAWHPPALWIACGILGLLSSAIVAFGHGERSTHGLETVSLGKVQPQDP